ncbi:65-kDa microtubule-associated protein 3-like [Rosa chinensis]|uniref:65-kDa microtubule-associated protein 3-like n=1 Tax=Rosa chinensis TaxID=74649 RepID=UPI001AD8C46B|nr:65-kDa microtubule-associated protein 3-like [Rosa chinensis]
MGVFRTKVDEAKQCKAQLQQAIANCEAEFVDICAILGEKPLHFDHKISGSLKKELEIIIPQLEVMKKRKIERKDQLFSVLDQLQSLSTEISRSLEDNLYKMVVEETDLSLKRLEELHRQLLEYQDEKLQTFASALLEMWNLMGTTMEEQKKYQNVTSRIATSKYEITETNILSIDLLNDVEAEVSKLEQLKSIKLKEILLKKKLELEEVVYITTETNSNAVVALRYERASLNGGNIDFKSHSLGKRKRARILGTSE